MVDQEVRVLIDSWYRHAIALLNEKPQRFEDIVSQLLMYETLDGAAVYAAPGIPRHLTPDAPAREPG